VPSDTYNLLKSLRDGTNNPFRDAAARTLRVGKDNTVTVLEPQRYGELSESDLECLEAIVDTYKRVGKWAIRDASHDEVWKANWRKRLIAKSIPMATEEIANDVGGEKLVDYLKDPERGSAD
jgi:hypothetical protein